MPAFSKKGIDMKNYNNCELFRIIGKHLYFSLVQMIYVFYVEHDFSEKYSFCEYLYYLYVLYVEDLDTFYENSPVFTLWEELRLIALERV